MGSSSGATHEEASATETQLVKALGQEIII